ncbi:hypothetical protein [Pseudoduganella ginsengisoli]|uniref:Uncharacterized protein n=1 Tax=Pseudoduganella ginsengisoli TaxID=1462440 RepID=A0A6L6PU14_9BURK|nr:hypothetical protein [Pseudoduganella ginsengisoli]MTW00508.1 hypothetical protein [Pseudoduganella ginsengisoli]
MVKKHDLMRATISLIAVIFVYCSDTLWSAAYHHLFPLSELVGVLFLYAAALSGFVFIPYHFISRKITLWSIDFLAILLSITSIFVILRRLQIIDAGVPLIVKIFLVVFGGGISGYLTVFSSDANLKKIRNMLTASALLFVFSPPLLVALTAERTEFPISALPSTSVAKPNVAIILLDELGQEAADPILKVLAEQRLSISSGAMKPLGENTVNVIPALLTGRDFSKAHPCSLSAVCSGNTVLDFARMKSPDARVDIVGFYHPYCEISGLRYCHMADPHAMKSSATWLSCVLIRMVYPAGLSYCNEQPFVVAQVNSARSEIYHALDNAPFWKEGGTLYFHIPLPHPPGKTNGNTLDEDYSNNIQDAAILVNSLTARLKSNFGNNFLLVVTSDHPLRPKLWCKLPNYAHNCELREQFQSKRVPLIMASPVDQLPPITEGDQLFQLVNSYRSNSPR